MQIKNVNMIGRLKYDYSFYIYTNNSKCRLKNCRFMAILHFLDLVIALLLMLKEKYAYLEELLVQLDNSQSLIIHIL
jgi:hypothetical protein